MDSRCYVCGGTGYITELRTVSCNSCAGTGRDCQGNICSTCGGRCVIDEWVNVTCPNH